MVVVALVVAVVVCVVVVVVVVADVVEVVVVSAVVVVVAADSADVPVVPSVVKTRSPFPSAGKETSDVPGVPHPKRSKRSVADVAKLRNECRLALFIKNTPKIVFKVSAENRVAQFPQKRQVLFLVAKRLRLDTVCGGWYN